MGYLMTMFMYIFLVLLMMPSTCDSHMVLCKATERKALLYFKSGLSGYSYYYDYYHDHHPMKKLCSSWVPEEEEDCCKWEGIGCDNRTGHVTTLNLPYAAGKLNHSLADLSYLQYLNLSYGDFGGSSVPAYFGSFKKLRYLDLTGTSFSGVIPPQLGNLSALQVLNLSYGDFGGISIPAYFGSFKKLRYLDLTCANFSGAIPPQLGNLSALQVLKLSTPYDLKSDGKWLSQLSSLRYLAMSGTNL